MQTTLLTPKTHELKRVAGILLITMLLLVIFSIGGMPMILLSTFSPSSIPWDTDSDHSDEYTIDGSSEAA